MSLPAPTDGSIPIATAETARVALKVVTDCDTAHDFHFGVCGFRVTY